jgi:Arc/MetJ-type ribon-helix-helix transcriptional regulator
MAQSDTEPDSGPGTTKINLRVSDRLLAEIEESWKEQGYNSRSEYIRQAIRDSVHTPELSARTLESLLVSERQRERGETVSSKEMRARVELGLEDEDNDMSDEERFAKETLIDLLK